MGFNERARIDPSDDSETLADGSKGRTEFYSEFMPFWGASLLAGQRVLTSWNRVPLLVHPNLRPKLLQMYRHFRKGHKFEMRSGVLDPKGKCMVDYGLGFKCWGDTVALMRPRFEWMGLIEVARGYWIVPKSMIAAWILEGTFVQPTGNLTWADPRLIEALGELPQFDREIRRAKSRGPYMPVGTRARPLMGRLSTRKGRFRDEP